MDRKVLTFIALVITLLYGVSFAIGGDARETIAPIGGVAVALAWIAVWMFGRDRSER